jgi:hypothetical protein
MPTVLTSYELTNTTFFSHTPDLIKPPEYNKRKKKKKKKKVTCEYQVYLAFAVPCVSNKRKNCM